VNCPESIGDVLAIPVVLILFKGWLSSDYWGRERFMIPTGDLRYATNAAKNSVKHVNTSSSSARDRDGPGCQVAAPPEIVEN
jgi:hypothetical protein